MLNKALGPIINPISPEKGEAIKAINFVIPKTKPNYKIQ